VITGGGGDDAIDGGAGNDRLSGGGGNDLVDGGVGNDTLLAGRGIDVLRLGPGRNSIVLGDLASSLRRLSGFATSTATQKNFSGSGRIDISLDNTLSGSIRFTASASGMVKRCETTIELAGVGTVSNLSHTTVLNGRTGVRCNGATAEVVGSVWEYLTGTVTLQTATITTTGSIETWFGNKVTRKRVRATDYLVEVLTDIA
jgi:hypothetical protein